jgi:uncharacterized membrane protein YeaQ/YmgE (transglycosylase-associated protein family)
MMQALMDLGGVGIAGTIIIGILAGWIAEKATGSDHGLLRNLIVGLIGSWIGFFVSNLAQIEISQLVQGWFWGNLIVSAIGATLFLIVMKMLRGRRTA